MKGNRRRAWIRPIIRNQRGATAIEYGLILALVFLGLLTGVSSLSSSVKDRWDDIANKVTSVPS